VSLPSTTGEDGAACSETASLCPKHRSKYEQTDEFYFPDVTNDSAQFLMRTQQELWASQHEEERWQNSNLSLAHKMIKDNTSTN